MDAMLGIAMGNPLFVGEGTTDRQGVRKRHRARHTKSRHGCFTCKLRRVKVYPCQHHGDLQLICTEFDRNFLSCSVMKAGRYAAHALLVAKRAPSLAYQHLPPRRGKKQRRATTMNYLPYQHDTRIPPRNKLAIVTCHPIYSHW